MTMEEVVALSEQFVDVELSVDVDRTRRLADSYRMQLIAEIARLDLTDLIVLALILVEGPTKRQ